MLMAYKAQYQFSVQLLRCCQRLYNEGRPLLYNSIELTIFCDQKYVSMLDTRFNKISFRPSNAPFGDIDRPAGYLTIGDTNVYVNELKQISDAMKRLQKINVVIEHSSQTWGWVQIPPYTNLATSVIGIRHLLYEKNVRVNTYKSTYVAYPHQSESFDIEGSQKYNDIQVLNH